VRWRIDVGNISGSPVLRAGRVYVGTDAGEVLSVRADDGLDVRTVALGDGPVRGFVFPDRTNDEVFVSTNTTVWRLADAAPWAVKWNVPINNPSIPLLWPGTTHVYVGGGDGRLYQIEIPTGTSSTLALDYDPAAFVVGAPSLDVALGILHVGSEHGTFYAVQVPIP
jgi:outer membrane protein assembly factor BamB